MGPPTLESLAGMGLLGKKESVITETLYLTKRTEYLYLTKRTEYFNQFHDANETVDELKQIKWGIDSSPTSCGIRCNANIVLLSIGAKIPASADGSRPLKDINPIIQYPLKALGEWGIEYLTCSHSTYKGMDRVLISEPSKMVVPRYYEYLPKKIHDTRNEVCKICCGQCR